ncbi:MAG TPA: AI-2E family transporter [Longimicrobiales bacterium]|nr:AI-2E family transporter [Longimicrobiales bacterium]
MDQRPKRSKPRPTDRRRNDRRSDWIGLGEYPIPELRKAFVTLILLAFIVVLFFYMVHEVMVGAIAGLVLGIYMLPFQGWLRSQLRNETLTAILGITLVTVPLLGILVYSWNELSGAAEYLGENRESVVHDVNVALHRLPYFEGYDIDDELTRGVAYAAARTGEIVDELQETADILVISVAVFLFTVFYILTDHERIIRYLRARIPGRYRDLSGGISRNMRAVVYGSLYATFLTQLIKSSLILIMNVVWDVPLALVLAIVSFFIGFFPVVGSWSVYVPVAIYLMVFRDNVLGGVLMIVIGFFVNTIFMSLYLRPKIAAERSQVLNFYWMFIALVTGVYTFGIIGIVIGPVLIAVLKAILDAIATSDEQSVGAAALAGMPSPTGGRDPAAPATGGRRGTEA